MNKNVIRLIIQFSDKKYSYFTVNSYKWNFS